MEDIRNAMRGEARRMMNNIAQPRFAIVDGVRQEDHTVRVRFQPDDALSGWLPVMSMSVGPSWGLSAIPQVGTQVYVTFQEGDPESGVVMGSVFSEQHRPPNTPVGAIHLFSKNGARFQLNADGTIDQHAGQIRMDADTLMKIASAALTQMVAATTAQVTAPTVQLGAEGATLRKLLNDLAVALYNGHTHNHGSGAGTTSPPNQQLTATHQTANVTAS